MIVFGFDSSFVCLFETISIWFSPFLSSRLPSFLSIKVDPDAKQPWDEVFVNGVLEITCQHPLKSEYELGKQMESHL